MNYKTFLNVLYVLLLLFVLRQIYYGQFAKKAVEGKLIAFFNPQSRFLIAFLSGMLILLGAYSITIKDYFGIVYLLSGIGFAYLSYQKIYIYDGGILYSTKFTRWENIKKWGYNEKTKNLEILTNFPKNPTRIIPLNINDKNEVLTIIKEKKRKK